MRHSQAIAVIGGVASGTAAAAEAKRVDPDARVVLFDKGSRISYGACEIPMLIQGRVEVEDLVRFSPHSFHAEKGVEVRVNTEVTAIDHASGRTTLRDVRTHGVWEERFDKFIIATGARAAGTTEVPGSDALNVFPVRTLDDADAIRRFSASDPDSHVVIVGGGYVGVEVAEALVANGHRVTILAPGGVLLPSYLDRALCEKVTSWVASRNVAVRDERMTRIVVDPANRVQAVVTSVGERIGCKSVVLATGVVPDTRLAQSLGVRLGQTGAIAVGDTMRTNVANVFACGDCIEVKRLVDGAAIHHPLSPTAYRTARVAARNAASRSRGSQVTFPGVCPASAVSAFGLEIASVGITADEAERIGIHAVATDIEHWSRVPIYPRAARLNVRYVVESSGGRLLGAQFVGEDGAAMRANVLVPLIRDRWTVDRVDDLDFVYNPPLSPPLDPLYVAARAALKLLRNG